MANKTKNTKTAIDSINDVALQGGMVLMAAAVTLGLTEVPLERDKRAVLPGQPAFAVAHDGGANPNEGHEVRRERDEVHPHNHGYGINQRTPARTRNI